MQRAAITNSSPTLPLIKQEKQQRRKSNSSRSKKRKLKSNKRMVKRCIVVIFSLISSTIMILVLAYIWDWLVIGGNDIHQNVNKLSSVTTTSLLASKAAAALAAARAEARVLKAKAKGALRRRPSQKIMNIELNSNYISWHSIALELASLPPSQTLNKLRTLDPFGVRTFDTELKERETKLQRSLEKEELKELWSCPNDGEYITKDVISADKSGKSGPDKMKQKSFIQRVRDDNNDNNKDDEDDVVSLKEGDDDDDKSKSGTGKTFLFFQHLRKAGGTFFCDLASRNLASKRVPKYYCMPDYKWTNYTNAGYLHDLTNKVLQKRMNRDGFMIAGNEWQNFRKDSDDKNKKGGNSNHLNLDAVFATSFRNPVDRALSQFRFECVESRGCDIETIEAWWPRRNDLRNIYVTTFADVPLINWKKISSDVGNIKGGNDNGVDSATAKANGRKNALGAALNVISQYHLILSMEWLSYAGPLVTESLGFKDTSSLIKRVRPHEGNAKARDENNVNNHGAAGISEASWSAEQKLGKVMFKIMSEDLALDEILNDAARRIFLERLLCQ